MFGTSWCMVDVVIIESSSGTLMSASSALPRLLLLLAPFLNLSDIP